MSEGRNTALLLAILLFTGISWGLTISLATIATSTGIAPMTVAFWAALIGAVVLTGVILDAINDILVTADLGTVCPGGDAVSDNADLALGNGAGGQEVRGKQEQGKKQQEDLPLDRTFPDRRPVQTPHRRYPLPQSPNQV